MIRFVFFLLVIISLPIQAQSWKTPAIEGYGRIIEYEEVAIKPNPQKEYKMFFHITNKKERDGVNASLWKIARLINLLEANHVPKESIQVAAVISGEASPIVLTEKAYKLKKGKSNPNLDLIKKLTDYGVPINICGQAAAERGINPETEMNPLIKLTLSALIDIPTYQMQGYTIIR
ncbi:DsrE family protein [uncultured Salegentibacter sp.]|uniref:DsrE family protein n=1 Tax=uncultured Salegentibacter sp. TaxID=259320 RepID=UPI0025989152|nr:DsrE family protein [uncultured Salegentibacter sp.]